MCGRYGQTEPGIINFASERKYAYKRDQLEIFTNYNLSPGNTTYFFKNTDEGVAIEQGRFGYVPFWNKKMMLINARAEGKEGKDKLNEVNDSSYHGAYNIGRSGAFSKAVKEHRCLLPVDYFIEGPEKEKLSKPFKIIRKDEQPFALAAIFSYVEDRFNVGIITTAAAPLLTKVGHHRSPFVLEKHQEEIWLDPEISYDEIEKLFQPFDSSDYEAYPLDPKIKSPHRRDKPNNDASLVEPIGEALIV